MKKITVFFVLAVILLGSCQKEIQPNGVDVSKLAATTSTVSTTPSISNAAIASWFVKNPMGQYLTVDWKNAKQATVGNVAVVTVPLKNISIPGLSGSKKTNDLTSSSNGPLTAFDPYHPPALYFFQDKTSATPDSVKALLMNFVPDDPKKEDGARKIWTGKLLEWDMQSNVAYYHHLNKSKVDDRSYINLNPSSANNSAKSKSVNAIGSKQTNTLASFLSDIWDAITVFFSDIATALNIPGYYPYTSGGAAIVYPCDFLWGLFCGGGGGGGGSGNSSTTDDEGNSYNFVYSGFVDGYNGYDTAQGVNWSLYLGGSGGGDSDTCTPQAVKGKTVQQLPGGCSPDGTTYVITPAMVINAFAVKYQLNSDQQDWLNNNKGHFYALSDYINNNLDLYYDYYDAEDYLNNSINYLIDNPTTPNDFISQFPLPPPGFDIDAPYTDEPGNDYKLDAPTTAAYPRFTKLVNQLPQYLAANPAVLTALMHYSGYNKAQIMQMVAPGNGPQIVVEEMTGDHADDIGHYEPFDKWGVLKTPNQVEINAAYVRQLEGSNSKAREEATAFLLAVTIFHETVHLGRQMHNLPDRYSVYEYGWGFEIMAFKVIISQDNDESLINYTFKLN